MEHGPTIVVVKRGEYGAALFTGDDTFAMPALPIAEVRDPTGAGDSFAGGFLGFLDGLGAHAPTNGELRQAMVRGSAMASFNVEDFGTDRVRRLERDEIDDSRHGLQGPDALLARPSAPPQCDGGLSSMVEESRPLTEPRSQRLAGAQHGVVARRQLLEIGMGSSTIAAGSDTATFTHCIAASTRSGTVVSSERRLARRRSSPARRMRA